MNFNIPSQDKGGEKTEALGVIDLLVQFLSADRQKSGRLSADQAIEFDGLVEELTGIVSDAAMKDEAPAEKVDYAKLKEVAERLNAFVKEL